MAQRYGIAEWYGRNFIHLDEAEIRTLAEARKLPCPFRYPDGPCNKVGGVCSLRLYEETPEGAQPADSHVVTTCPNRFLDAGRIFSEVASFVIGTKAPTVTTEIPFLIPPVPSHGKKAVGMIDMVLVDEQSSPLNWCALEIQAVYFSGKSMSREIGSFKNWAGPGLPFPKEIRRPDFRSSGPKRLMPQLLTKVPTLSRWGKKLAVVVDRSFWQSLAPMETVDDLSNCDIAWFVVDYVPEGTEIKLGIDSIYMTTLQHAVTGLTGGLPTSLGGFETDLKEKIKKSGIRVEPL